MNTHVESGEGNSVVEAAEKQLLGTTSYENAEMVHRFADENVWVHPLLLCFVVIVLGAIVMWLIHRRQPIT